MHLINTDVKSFLILFLHCLGVHRYSWRLVIVLITVCVNQYIYIKHVSWIRKYRMIPIFESFHMIQQVLLITAYQLATLYLSFSDHSKSTSHGKWWSWVTDKPIKVTKSDMVESGCNRKSGVIRSNLFYVHFYYNSVFPFFIFDKVLIISTIIWEFIYEQLRHGTFSLFSPLPSQSQDWKVK